MGRKLLAMDIDGTAVRDDYSMGTASKKAIEEAKRAGHVIAYVSGRRDIDMLTLKDDERWIVDYHILNTGGKILRCCDREVLYNKLIPPAVCRRLLAYCFEKNLQLQICDGMIWKVTKMTEQTMEYARNGIEGFMATSDLQRVAEYIDQYLPEIYYVNSEPGCVDIMASGVSKWRGIKILAESLNIAHEDILTVGNYYNDIDMLQHAGVGIAVANSLPEVKDVADFVTEYDNNHDAVAEIISKMLHHEYDMTK